MTFTLNHLVGELNRHADRILRDEFGLTYSQFLFLVSLASSGPVSSGVLAKNLGVSRAAVSKRTAWFTSRGFVRSGSARDDSRVVRLAITERGLALVQRMSEVLESRFRSTFDDLPGLDLEQLNQTLLTILAKLQAPSTLAAKR